MTENTENTEKLLRELADKLGTTTEKLYGVLVKQAKVRIITNTVSIIAYLAIGIIAPLLIHSNISWLEPNLIKTGYRAEYVWAPANYLFVAGWTSIIILLMVCISCIWTNVNSIVSDKMNPEYNALLDILDVVKPNND